jgi:uncharacterized protein YndB with AHSA1/START domain
MASLSPPGRVAQHGAQSTLEFQRTYPHPVERVWAAITDPEQLARWYMARDVKLDARPGGRVEMSTGPSQFRVTGKVLACEPPRLFEHEWNVAPREELPQGERATVRWELAPLGSSTVLTLTHARLTTPTALGFAPGTHVLLDRLAAMLSGEPMPDFMRRYGEVAASYPPMPQRPG